ncbi:MAG: hypothetical protein HY508_07370 [Acidobacteria bacterium]|nr:hypothetical protein [Acidobacteriota bacterium]
MKIVTRFIVILAAAIVVAVLILRETAKQRQETQAPAPVEKPRAFVPPYYADVRGVPIPKTLPPEQFKVVKTRASYRVAGEIPQVLMQLPCYCWCDRIGHKSLLDCFVNDHGEYCGICQDSALWADKRLKERASAETIRQEVITNYSR